MPFIGNQPALSYTSFAKQDFTTSATTSYTLDNPVANANELALFINFVRQEPTTAYSASGTTLTLTSATSSSDDMYAIFLGKAIQTVNPPNASVGTSQLADNAVTTAKITDANITSAKLASGVLPTNTPAFMARMGSSQSITNNAEVKVQCNVEVFDTANCYDNSTNYRFTPTTAGKYLIVHGLRGSLSVSRFVGWIRRNGSTDHAIAETNPNLNATAPSCLGSCIIDFNGTSDYVEYYCYHTSGSAKSLEATNGYDATFFQGFKLIT